MITRFVAAALVLVAILIAIPIFILTGLVLVAVTTVLHAQGTVAAVLSIVWFIGFLVLFGIVIRTLVRRLWPTRQGPAASHNDPGDNRV